MLTAPALGCRHGGNKNIYICTLGAEAHKGLVVGRAVPGAMLPGQIVRCTPETSCVAAGGRKCTHISCKVCLLMYTYRAISAPRYNIHINTLALVNSGGALAPDFVRRATRISLCKTDCESLGLFTTLLETLSPRSVSGVHLIFSE
jgi:hypothetical protein